MSTHASARLACTPATWSCEATFFTSTPPPGNRPGRRRPAVAHSIHNRRRRRDGRAPSRGLRGHRPSARNDKARSCRHYGPALRFEVQPHPFGLSPDISGARSAGSGPPAENASAAPRRSRALSADSGVWFVQSGTRCRSSWAGTAGVPSRSAGSGIGLDGSGLRLEHLAAQPPILAQRASRSRERSAGFGIRYDGSRVPSDGSGIRSDRSGIHSEGSGVRLHPPTEACPVPNSVSAVATLGDSVNSRVTLN